MHINNNLLLMAQVSTHSVEVEGNEMAIAQGAHHIVLLLQSALHKTDEKDLYSLAHSRGYRPNTMLTISRERGMMSPPKALTASSVSSGNLSSRTFHHKGA